MLRVLEYGDDREPAFRAIPAQAVPALVAAAAAAPLLWVDVDQASDEEVSALAAALQWHPLVTEDVRNRGQRQKVEQFPGQVLAVLHRPSLDRRHLRFDELQTIVTERVLVTAHVDDAPFIDGVAATVARRPDITQNGAACAVATLLAVVVDGYERAIDGIEELVAAQEADALESDGGDPVPALRKAAATRTAVARVRRASGQVREVIGVFVRRELIDVLHSSELDLELRDIQDHAVRAHDDLDVLHDQMSALADTRLAMVAYRQNEITKRLSAWGAILIVPASVTGWFGQNFDHMIGLGWRFGEAYALGVVLALCTGMWFVLRRARWL